MPFQRKSAKARVPLDEPHLYDYAVKALGRQMRTEAELRRMMTARAEMGEQGEAAVRAVVGRLKEHGYLNDRSFAETYARLRQQNEKLGERRVRNDLQQKGVRAEVIEEAVGARYGETNEETLAREHLERKRIKKPENERETAIDEIKPTLKMTDEEFAERLDYMDLNPVKKGLVKRQEDWRWSSYNNFALDKATVAACPIQIDYVRLPLGYRA